MLWKNMQQKKNKMIRRRTKTICFSFGRRKKNIFIFFITLNIFIKCASFGMYWWKQDIRPTVVVVVIKMKSFDGDLLFSARIVFIVLLFVPMDHGYTFNKANQTKSNKISQKIQRSWDGLVHKLSQMSGATLCDREQYEFFHIMDVPTDTRTHTIRHASNVSYKIF